MMTTLQILELDMKIKMPFLVVFIFYINHVSGMHVPQPDKLEVNISDGEVTLLWKDPVGAPSDYWYNVQMARYVDEWAELSSCTRIKRTYCHLSSFIDDYSTAYKVRVQLVTKDDESNWTKKKILPNQSNLLPPSFTLWATSSTLTIYVHEKPILKKLFPFGVTYTIYLEEIGQDNTTTIAYMTDDEGADQRTKIFPALQWGKKYCVSLKVEGNGALSISSMSEQQCLNLPEQEWFIIAASSLSVLGVFAVIAIMGSIVLCYLRPSAKTPASLKTPVSGWLPLSVVEGTMEVVTDRAWFLTSSGAEVKNSVKLPVTHVTVIEDNKEDRRTSMDSGVGMESNSATSNGGSPPMRQEDSGCGSMGGPESSTGCQTDYPMKDERTEADAVRKSEDSGVGMSCQHESSSMSLDGQDSVPVMESVPGGNYRSQSPSAVQIHVCDNEDMFKQIPADSVLAEVVTGYRTGPQSCICSGAGQCSWCHKYGHYGREVVKQYRAVCIENELLGNKSNLVDSYKRNVTFSGYPSETQVDIAMMNDLEKFLQMNETFPLLTSLPLDKCEQDFNMNNVSLSLCDVQLTSD
ncbi:interleukin-10 receptor subunit alpha [Leuresthes tenuis]|uniref:interleukin-10 receptor subunit alpha n=1 Tax=Leuresthes tenuis TaxID=355514 RepID=UPI003B5004DF